MQTETTLAREAPPAPADGAGPDAAPAQFDAAPASMSRPGPGAGNPVGRSDTDHDAICTVLFHAHFRGLVVLADLLGADDPENVVQEAFLRLHHGRTRLRDPGAAHGYLRRIVINLTRTRIRHLQVARLHAPLPEPEAAGPEEIAVARSDAPAVLAALRLVAPRYREALVLRYWLSLPDKEIARLMGVSVGTVKSHVSRGLALLRPHLEEVAGHD